LQLAFHIVIGEERGTHDAEAVTQGLERKMWRRHPHLFEGGEKPESWEGIKRREQGAGSGTLRGLPSTMPPLLMSYRLQERAAGVGFDWPDAKGPLAKVKEETAELERETGDGRRETIEEELGDLLFAVVNLARKLGVEPSQALEKANDKFTKRFGAVERLADERGVELGRAKLEELDRLWDEVKANG
jgi:MazG family protein